MCSEPHNHQCNKLGYNPAFAQLGRADQLTGRLKAGYLGLNFFFLILTIFISWYSGVIYSSIYWASLLAQVVRNPPANEGDAGSIPGSGR